MAFKVSVPKVGLHEAKVVWCNFNDEGAALQAAEILIGYKVGGLPYIVKACDNSIMKEAGIDVGTAALQSADRFNV